MGIGSRDAKAGIGAGKEEEEGMGLKKDEEDITFVESVLGRNRDLAAQDAETTT